MSEWLKSNPAETHVETVADNFLLLQDVFMLHSVTAGSTDKAGSGRVLWRDETPAVWLMAPPGVEVCSSILVWAAVALAGEVPVVGDVLPPGHGAPQEAAVGDGQLSPGLDISGRHQGEAVVSSVQGLRVGPAAVREDTHTGVEHPHLPLLGVLTGAYLGTAAHPVDPGDPDTPLNLLLSPVFPPRPRQPQYRLDHRGVHPLPLRPPAQSVLPVVHQPAQSVLQLPAGRVHHGQQSHRHHQRKVRPAATPPARRHEEVVLRLVLAGPATLGAAEQEPALALHTWREMTNSQIVDNFAFCSRK